jgi:hypothetical protein
MTLLELAERCEQATGPDRELDAEIAEASGNVPEDYQRATHYGEPRPYFWHKFEREGEIIPLRYTASLDAAMTLVPEGLEGRVEWRTGKGMHPAYASMWGCGARDIDRHDNGHGKTPALALCAAALRARAGQQP